jgi:hypothetical protein
VASGLLPITGIGRFCEAARRFFWNAPCKVIRYERQFAGTHCIAVALGHATSAVQANPGFSLVFVVASNVKRGHIETARAAAQRLLEIDPAFSIGNFRQIGYIRQPLADQVANALRTAGLPE